MFNLDYLKFLIKSKKYLLIFETLVCLLLSITSGTAIPRTLLLLFALAICYIAPFNIFSFVHDKKAIDSYFSLPVERKSLLITGLAFCIATVYIPFEIGITINSLLNPWCIESFILGSLIMLLSLSCLVVFNTLLYFVANNKLDGIITTFAYSTLPYAIFLVIICFFEVFVCGNFDIDYDTLLLLSPIYNTILLFSRNVMDCINNVKLSIVDLRYIIALVLELVSSFILLVYSFTKRKVEVAETVSKRFFAYPLIIALYCSLCMFGISSGYSFDFATIWDFLAENMLLYVILFVLFVAANFIYQRKFYFNFKMLAYYLIVFALSLTFCFIARYTKGFGLSNNYDKNDLNVYYVLNFDYNEYDSTLANTDNDKLLYKSVSDWLNDRIDEEIDWFDVNIDAKKPKNQNTIDFFEKRRLSAIEDFYKVESAYNKYYHFARMNIYNNYNYKDDTYSYDNQYYYSNYDDITIDELLDLAKDPCVKITIYANNEYRLNTNGELILVEYQETVVEKY